VPHADDGYSIWENDGDLLVCNMVAIYKPGGTNSYRGKEFDGIS